MCVSDASKFASITLPALEVKGPIFVCVYVLRGKDVEGWWGGCSI